LRGVVGISCLVTSGAAAYHNRIAEREVSMLRAVLGLAMLIASPAVADGSCAFDAYTGSDDLADIPIHAGPSDASAVLGMAPVEVPDSDYAEFGTGFRVVEMQDGWARITDVTSVDGTATGPDGWIDGRHIGFEAQTEVAFAAPDAASDVVWAGEQWPFADGLLDCSGAWALIRFGTVDGSGPEPVVTGPVTGWVRGVCANQLTTCDGIWGDWRE
jgi:hypothetical protein